MSFATLDGLSFWRPPWIVVALTLARVGLVAAGVLAAAPSATTQSMVGTALPQGSSGAVSVSTSNQIPLRLGPTRVFGGGVPAGWRDRAFDDRAWPVAPGLVVPRMAFASGLPAPDGVTAIDAVAFGSLFTRTRFDVDRLGDALSLELRLVYRDGFVAYLNGVELTRRNVPIAPVDAHPLVAHGAEPERIFFQVPLSGPRLQATDNVLAIEVRPAAGRAPLDATAPSFEVGLAAFSGVRLVRGPYLVAPAEGTISVAWETDLPARGRVRFQPVDGDATSARQAFASKVDRRQLVRLTNLTPGTRYRYQVDVEGLAPSDRIHSTPASFQSAPRRDQPLRLIVYGDMRAPGHAAHSQMIAALLHEQPALVANTGDLVAVGSEESAWQRYFEITAPLGAIAPVVPALGNHEAHLGGAAKSWALFGLRTSGPERGTAYTSFDWGGAHFIILDSNHLDAGQRDWLARDLATVRRTHPRALFALCHDGPWSHGTHGGSRAFEREFAPLLAAAGTTVLFAGHDHLYERGIGITPRGPLRYVVTGGGGAPLYNSTCQTATSPPASPGPGVLSLPACPESVAIIRKAYHYVVVEVDDRKARLCPRLTDGGALEPCVEIPLRGTGGRSAAGTDR